MEVDMDPAVPEADIVRERDTVILNVNDKNQIFCRVTPNFKARIGKKNYVPVEPLIGCPYGSFFEVEKNTFVRIPQKPDLLATLVKPIDVAGEISRDNRFIGEDYQGLSEDELEKLKSEGLSGQQLVTTIVSSSSRFAEKTPLAQQKYVKKKQEKYMKIVQVVRPTAATLCAAYFERKPNKICYLRSDSLGQILTLGNIFSGQDVLLYEECTGLLIGSIAERLAGRGTLLNMFPGGSPNQSITSFFNLSDEEKSIIMHWSPRDLSRAINGMSLEFPIEDFSHHKTEEKREKAMKLREEKKKAREDKLNYTLEHLQAGFDSLVIAVPGDPSTVFRQLYPYLKPSGAFCVFSQYREPLATLTQKLFVAKAAIHVTLSESWMREYQVLPRRTHPMMQTSGGGGYIVSGYKLVSDFGDGALKSLSLEETTDSEKKLKVE